MQTDCRLTRHSLLRGLRKHTKQGLSGSLQRDLSLLGTEKPEPLDRLVPDHHPIAAAKTEEGYVRLYRRIERGFDLIAFQISPVGHCTILEHHGSVSIYGIEQALCSYPALQDRLPPLEQLQQSPYKSSEQLHTEPDEIGPDLAAQQAYEQNKNDEKKQDERPKQKQADDGYMTREALKQRWT